MNQPAEHSPAVRLSMLDIGLPGFYMSPVGGKDQVVIKALESGWWSFEQPLPAVMLKCFEMWPGTLLDLGANTGFYSLMIATAYESASVVCYEPDPKIVSTLKENISANNLDNRITLNQVALSHTSGTAELFVPLQGHGLVETSSSLESSFKTHHSASFSVATKKLDDYIDILENVTLIKIDVEGHEKGAVQGAIEVLRRFRPITIVELLGEADYSYFNNIKSELKFRSYALRELEVVYEDVMAFDLTAWNHVLVPEEKERSFLLLIEALGLKVSR